MVPADAEDEPDEQSDEGERDHQAFSIVVQTHSGYFSTAP